MPRIFRAQSCINSAPLTRGQHSITDQAAHRKGFTIIEVVISLALCALVAGAVASSLSAALGAEHQAVKLREQRRAAATLQQALRVTGQADDLLVPLREQWQTIPSSQVTGAGTNQVRWMVWELIRNNDPSQRSFLATRE